MTREWKDFQIVVSLHTDGSGNKRKHERHANRRTTAKLKRNTTKQQQQQQQQQKAPPSVTSLYTWAAKQWSEKLKNTLYPSKIFLVEHQAFSAGLGASGAGFESFMNWETRNCHSMTVTATFTKRMNQETGCIPRYMVWGMLCREEKRGDLKKYIYIKGWMKTRVCSCWRKEMSVRSLSGRGCHESKAARVSVKVFCGNPWQDLIDTATSCTFLSKSAVGKTEDGVRLASAAHLTAASRWKPQNHRYKVWFDWPLS